MPIRRARGVMFYLNYAAPLFFAIAVALLVSLLPAHSLRAADWALVWSDEFETPGRPDPTKWG